MDLLPLVAGGVLSIASLILGLRIQRQDEDHQWVRDRRLDAYTSVLGASHEMWAFLATYRSPSAHLYAEELVADHALRVLDAHRKLSDGAGLVNVLGPNDVAAHVLGLRICWDEALEISYNPEDPDDPNTRTPLIETPTGQKIQITEALVASAARRAIVDSSKRGLRLRIRKAKPARPSTRP